MADINTYLKNNQRPLSGGGAPMGDTGYIHPECPTSGMRCQRIRMVDYAYGPDGTYWGKGDAKHGFIYAVFNNNNEEYQMACGVLKYYRAHTRKEAMDKFRAENPGFTFAKRN